MKKLLSLLLVVVILMSIMVLPVGAANQGNNGKNVVALIDENAFYDVRGDAALYPETTRPGSEILIPLVRNGFWDDSNERIDWDGQKDLGPTVRQLKNNKIVPTLHVVKGIKYVRDISLVEFTPTGRIRAQAAVRIRFIKEVYTTEEILYEIRVYLSLNNSHTDAVEVFGGKLYNFVYDVYQRDYVFIGDGTIAEAQGGTQLNVEMDLGNGVSVFRDMYKGDRFYGRASINDNTKQDKITAGTSEIFAVIDMKTIDVKFNGRPIKLKELAKDPTEYYVFNLAGDYIGTTHEMLPYSVRYYISNSMLEIPPELAEVPTYTEDESKYGEALTNFLQGGRDNLVP